MEIEKGTKFRSVKREIKFRAWDKIKKEMVELTLLGLHYGFHKELTVYGVENDKGNISTNAPVMQYTGLKDCNNKEIYEGDIFNYDGEIDTIDSIEDFYFNELIEYRMSEGKIIGNIYENPELLKELKK